MEDELAIYQIHDAQDPAYQELVERYGGHVEFIEDGTTCLDWMVPVAKDDGVLDPRVYPREKLPSEWGIPVGAIHRIRRVCPNSI